MCSFEDSNGKFSLLQADHVRIRLRSIVNVIREEKFGFSKDDIELHSIRWGDNGNVPVRNISNNYYDSRTMVKRSFLGIYKRPSRVFYLRIIKMNVEI